MHPPKLGLSLDKPVYYCNRLSISGKIAFQFSTSVQCPLILLSYHREVRNGRLPLSTKELKKWQKEDAKQKEKEDFGESEHTREIKVPRECKANELCTFPFELFIEDNVPPSLETELKVVKHKLVASLRVTKSRNAGKWGVTVELPVIPTPPTNSSTMIRQLAPAPLCRNVSGSLELEYNKAVHNDGTVYLLLRYLPETHPVRPGNHPPLSVVANLLEHITFPRMPAEKVSLTIASIVENLPELDGTIKLVLRKSGRPDYKDADVHVYHDISVTVEFDNRRQHLDNIFQPLSLTVPVMIIGGSTPSDFRPPSPAPAYSLPRSLNEGLPPTGPSRLQFDPRHSSGNSIKSQSHNDPRVAPFGRSHIGDHVPQYSIPPTESAQVVGQQNGGKPTEKRPNVLLRTDERSDRIFHSHLDRNQVNGYHVLPREGQRRPQAQRQGDEDTKQSTMQVYSNADGSEQNFVVDHMHAPRPKGGIIESTTVSMDHFKEDENMYRGEFESTVYHIPRTRVPAKSPLNDQSGFFDPQSLSRPISPIPRNRVIHFIEKRQSADSGVDVTVAGKKQIGDVRNMDVGSAHRPLTPRVRHEHSLKQLRSNPQKYAGEPSQNENFASEYTSIYRTGSNASIPQNVVPLKSLNGRQPTAHIG